MKDLAAVRADAWRWASPARPMPWVLLAGAGTLVVHAVILVALRRGFDWSDEAWSYSLIANSRITEGEAWGYQHLLHGPFGLLGESVLAFRVVRFAAYGALTVVATTVLARISAVLGFTLRRWEWWLVLVVSQIGTFLAFSAPPRYFAYNELTALLVQGGVLCIAALVARSGSRILIRRPSIRAAVWAATGSVAVLLCITKFTSGAAFGLVFLAALIVGDRAIGWLRRFSCAAAGAALTVGLLLLTGFPLGPFVASIRGLLFDSGAQAANGHSPKELLTSYHQTMGDALQGLLVPLALFAVLVGLLFLASDRLSTRARPLKAGVAVCCALFVISITTMPRIETFPSVGRFVLLMAATAVLAVIGALAHRGSDEASPQWDAPRLLGVAAVAAAPFMSAVGTNVNITGQLLYAATVWCAVVGISFVLLARRLEREGRSFSTLPVAFLTLFVAVSATQVAGETQSHPYRSAAYLSQGTSTSAPFLQGILVTKPEAQWADWLVSEGDTLGAAKTPTLALASPGALLIFNNSDFASPWLEDFWSVSFGSIDAACGGERPEQLLVLQPATETKETANFQLFRAALKRGCGIDFPGDFEVASSHDSVNDELDTTIWRLRR